MAVSEFESKKWQSVVGKYVESIRPTEIMRAKLDYAFKFDGKSFELFSIRPQWNNEKNKIEAPFAKATYVESKQEWKVYWQRADMKWHLYKPDEKVKTIEKFIAVVEKDEYCCFFG
jgi:hypothetical protein